MFFLDGKSNIQLGLIAEEETFVARAPIIYDEISVDYKDGSDFIEKKYANVTGSMNVYFTKKKKIDEIMSLLTGTHELVYKDRKTTIRFYDLIEINRFGSIQSATVNFIRSPFWYPKNETCISLKGSGYISNCGNVYSKPKIILEGTGKSVIKINHITFEYDFDEDGKVIIDCEEKTESFNNKSKSKNIKIGFEYPILTSGTNFVEVSEGTTIKIYRKDRWL